MYKRKQKTGGLSKKNVPSFSSSSSITSNSSTVNSLQESKTLLKEKQSFLMTKSSLDLNSSPKARSTPLTEKVSELDEVTSEDEIQPSPKKLKSSRNLNISSISKNDKNKQAKSSISMVSNKTQVNLTYMEEVVLNCGFILSKDKSANILSRDQAVFIRDLNKALSYDVNDLSRNVDNFIKDLEKYCSEEHNLKNGLLPTETSPNCDIARGATQDCFLRLLLHVDPLQSKITDFLLDKLAEIVMSNESSSSSDTAIITWVRMILQCLRFLDRDINGSTIYDRLFDIIIGASDDTVQLEVINYLPDIIGDAEHHDAAMELSKLVRSTPKILSGILEALTNLSLQTEVRAEIQPILIRALRKVQPEFLPNMIKFLFTCNDPTNVDEIITSLRSELIFDQGHTDIATIQILVYSNIKDVLLSSRHLSDIWLKNINGVLSHLQHKPIDLVMLLLLHSTAMDISRQKSVEAVFRNKIKSGMFLEGIIQETFLTHIAVVKEYFTPLMKIASVLLKSPEPNVAEFAATLYSELFSKVDGYWCKWIVTELQVYIGAGDSSNARSALNILQELTFSHHPKIKPYATLLMMLLNKVNELQLNEIRQLMDILCRIAYCNVKEDEEVNDCAVLQDEINMLVQKELASSHISILRSGIVSSVMAIKHMTSIYDSKEATDSSVDNFTLSTRAKRAIPLLELVLTSTKMNAEVQGLALDELSHMLATGSNFDQTLLQRMSTLMQDSLQDSFLLSTTQFNSKNDELDISLQFKINGDYEDVLVLNLGQLVLEEAQSANQRMKSKGMPLVCLHPLLRLIRRLEIKDLTEIDGLLGCAIAMPIPSVYVQFSTLSPNQQHMALHCLFHCINWLREVINCFAFLAKKEKADKILIRLRTVVWLQAVLSRCLPLAMEYTPPPCHFASSISKPVTSFEKTAKKTKKPGGKKGKQKKRDSGDSTMLSGDTVTQQPEEPETNSTPAVKADLHKYKQYFRELDIDVWLILTQPLSLSTAPEKDGVFSPELGPSELLFLMDDYVEKVSRSLSASVKRICFLKTVANQNLGFENLDYFPSVDIAKNTIKLLPNLCTYLDKTMEYTENLLRASDGVLDSTAMFVSGSAEIKKCQGRILQVLATLFAWSGFNNQANHELLLGALQKLAGRFSSESNQKAPKKNLVHECVRYLQQCQSRVLDLSSAVCLVSLIKALVRHADNDKDLQAQIAHMSFEFLSRQWYDLSGNREKGGHFNNNVDTLLSLYFHCSKNGLETITKTLEWLLTEVQELSEKEATLNTFPVFSKINLHLLIAGLLKGLESTVKAEVYNISENDQINVWLNLSQAMESIVAVVKAQDSKPNLRAFLKGSTTVLKLFLSQAMPVCTYMFKRDPPLVTQVLKKLQTTTRYLQTICNFIKVSNDATLTQFLPPVRAVMETILLKVKNLVILNNCSDAFFMGSMKNRDLKGELIISQVEDDEDHEELGEESGVSDEENSNEQDEQNDSAAENVSSDSISQAC